MESVENMKLPLSGPKKSEKGQEKQGSTMTRKGVYAALSYMAASVLLVMFNKAALSSYKFPFSTVISFSQMVCAFIILYVIKSLMIVSFTTSEYRSTSYNPTTFVPPKTLARALPLALTYLLYVVVTMEAVRGINIPMYTTLRRTTVAFTMIVEYFMWGKGHSNLVIGSVGIIIAGAFVAGARDLAFDAYAYSIVFVENMCKAIYLASVSHIGKSTGLNIFGLMWCNVVICGPMLLVWSILTGDLQSTLNFPYLFDPGFQVICGNLKDVFTSGFGWLIFGGLPYDLFNVLGQSVGFLGSCLYAYCKLQGI